MPNNNGSSSWRVLRPRPSAKMREGKADRVRVRALNLHDRHDDGEVNDDLDLPGFPATYTKGLPHDRFGIPETSHVHALVAFLNQKRPHHRFRFVDSKGANIPLGPARTKKSLKGVGRTPSLPDDDPREVFVSKEAGFGTDDEVVVRRLESPLAGHVYDLQGPDASASSLPPAPAFGSTELTFEMAEVYALALARDEKF